MTGRIALTSGEPAGIGPDLILSAAVREWDAALVALGDRALFEARASQLGLSVELLPYTSGELALPHERGKLPFIDLPLSVPCEAGVLAPENASYVLAQLDLASVLCESGECAAMVTAPINKANINDAGIPFTGHTEYLEAATQSERVVMMLIAGNLRVALATTHLPLRAVPNALDTNELVANVRIVDLSLRRFFGIEKPQITVLGVNPHAGEDGHLGDEEIEIITPACELLRAEGMEVFGPVPADTAFIPSVRNATDAYLAMYHDQGLPVLKALGFHEAVNVSLGLPIIRTSVDHGTALDLAASGAADTTSMMHAIETAILLTTAPQATKS